MMPEEKHDGTIRAAGMTVLQHLMKEYWGPMWKRIQADPGLLDEFTAFLLSPDKWVVYFGPTHVAVEYVGPERKEKLEAAGTGTAQIFDYTRSEDFFEDILGFSLGGTARSKLPIADVVEGAFVPSNQAFEILTRNGWNFAAQPMILGMNASGLYVPEDEFARLVNCFFYGSDDDGLLVRHIQWMDFFPMTIRDVDEKQEEMGIRYWSGMSERVEADIAYTYPLPTEFQEEKLVRLNRFIELFSASGVDEPTITRYLSEPENQFILKMGFFGTAVAAECECPWAEGDRPAVKPDFFVTQPNGFADIVEFKLPNLKNAAVVGPVNRERFSAEIHGYVAQTRAYRDYFDDPRNRREVFDEHGIRVSRPRRWLVLGRRWDFESEQWREIEAEFPGLTIRTYDDIVAGVRAQLYS